MSEQLVQKLAEHPWLTVLASWLGSSALSALISGVYNLRAKKNEYVNEYYKIVIKRRIAAYETAENLIAELKVTVVDRQDPRPYHFLLSSENEEDVTRALLLLHNVMTQGLWLSDDIFIELKRLNAILFGLEKGSNLIEFAKQNYQSIATSRASLERLVAKDMLLLHDVKRFLKSKDKPDSGFEPFSLKR